MRVTLWSRAGCGPCLALKAALRAANVPYAERSLDDATPGDIARWRAAGALSAPIVEYPGDTFGGMLPDKVRTLIDKERAPR